VDLPDDIDPELLASVGLTLVPGIGPRACRALLERFGCLAAAWQASREELCCVEGLAARLGQQIATARDDGQAADVIAQCRRLGIGLLTLTGDDYPRLLSEIPDPPCVLYQRGDWLPSDALSIAIVGTRHATQYGLRQAEQLAGSLARCGLTIVSGLARGIDAAAHRGALAADGRTTAVLAGSLLRVYPPEHAKLATQLQQRGALLSESPLEDRLRPGAFPRRNRLISGLSLGVVVVEAGERSGALTTARHALEQGREVFAVPGRVDQRNSRGCHRLLRDGAKLVESADDVLEELGPLTEAVPDRHGLTVHHPAELRLNEQERTVLEAIEHDPIAVDQVVTRSRLSVSRVLATLSVLEMRRLIRRVAGDRVVRTNG
jgi:DNA processing protein